MPIIALIVIALVALAILGAVVHLLFSPLVLVVAAVLAWIAFRPRRSHR